MSGGRMKKPRFWVVLASAAPAVLAIAVLMKAQTAAPATNPRAFFDKYCVTCHDHDQRTSGLALDTLDYSKPGENAEVWEKVIVKGWTGSMSHPAMPGLNAATYRAVAVVVVTILD